MPGRSIEPSKVRFMTNKVVLSLGLFGPLSAASAPRQEVLERIAELRKYRIFWKENSLSDKDRVGFDWTGDSFEPSCENILADAFQIVLIELNGLVESLVLADSIVMFSGYDSRKSICPGSWFYTQIWPDEANGLKHRALDKLDVESTYSSNRSFDEVDQALDAL
jgi:hypothetical protein